MNTYQLTNPSGTVAFGVCTKRDKDFVLVELIELPQAGRHTKDGKVLLTKMKWPDDFGPKSLKGYPSTFPPLSASPEDKGKVGELTQLHNNYYAKLASDPTTPLEADQQVIWKWLFDLNNTTTYYRWMLISFYSNQKPEHGRNSWNKQNLTEMDAAVGLAGWIYDSKTKKFEKTRPGKGNDDYAYAPLTQLTIFRGTKGRDNRTVRDGGAGWTYPRPGAPTGVAQDEWLDLWTTSDAVAISKGIEIDLVELKIGSKLPPPKGWSTDKNVQIPENLKKIKESLGK